MFCINLVLYFNFKSSLLFQKYFAELQEELAKNIKEQMGITSHISDILNIQRQYVSNSENTRRDPVNLKSVLCDALSILMASIEKREIELQADIPEECPSFVGDRTKLIQVFINLIKNALDAIDDAVLADKNHPKELKLKLSIQESSLEVLIKDSGVGFAAEEVDNLFERGFSTKTHGSGIGLATSRSVVESHSGSLKISSEGTGKGAKVLVNIPLNSID